MNSELRNLIDQYRGVTPTDKELDAILDKISSLDLTVAEQTEAAEYMEKVFADSTAALAAQLKEQAEQQMSELNARINSLTKDLDIVRTHDASSKQEYERQIASKEKEIKSLIEQNNALKNELDERKAQCASLGKQSQDLSEIQRQYSSLLSEYNNLKSVHSSLLSEFDDFKSTHHSLRSSFDSNAQAYKKAEEEFQRNISSLENQVKEQKTTIDHLQTTIREQKNAKGKTPASPKSAKLGWILAALFGVIAIVAFSSINPVTEGDKNTIIIQERLDKANATISELESQLADSERRLTETEKKLSDAQAAISSSEKASVTQEMLDSVQTIANKQKSQISDLQNKLKIAENKIRELRNN